MADKKISELTSITGANVSDASDTIAIVDSSAGQTKKITREELFKDVDGAEFTGAVTLGGSQNYVGNTSSSALNFLRTSGPSFLDAENSGTTLFRFRDDSETGAAEIDRAGTSTTNALTVVTREKGDARYTQTSSDERLKENILEMEDVGGLIDSLRPIRFNWKGSENDPKPEGLMYGMIAQEVSQVAPENFR